LFEDEIAELHRRGHGFEQIGGLSHGSRQIHHRPSSPVVIGLLPRGLHQGAEFVGELLMSTPSLGRSHLQGHGVEALIVTSGVTLKERFDLEGSGHWEDDTGERDAWESRNQVIWIS